VTAGKPGLRRAPDEGRMALMEHIRELRYRVFVSFLAIMCGVIVAWIFYQSIFTFMTHPYCRLPAAHRLGFTAGDGPHRTSGPCALIVTGVLDAFLLRLKICTYVGIVFASPVWLWQFWAFITPGLHAKERKGALSFVGASLFLFSLGALFAYISLSNGLRFLLHFAGAGLTPLIQIDRYINFFLAMVFIFGASFEFPLLVVAINFVGLVSYDRLRSLRRVEIFSVFVFAAIVTPSQDPYTMTLLAVPMCVFYEIALLFARWHDRRKARREDSPYAGLGDDETSPLDIDVGASP
jgi:sec-independent protein translocase protein TatC